MPNGKYKSRHNFLNEVGANVAGPNRLTLVARRNQHTLPSNSSRPNWFEDESSKCLP